MNHPDAILPGSETKQPEEKPKPSPTTGWFEYILTHYRGVFATIVLLPVSVIYNFIIKWRNRIIFLMRSAPSKHDQRVEKVQEQIRQWVASGSEQKLCTARSPWLAMSDQMPVYKKSSHRISIPLYDILEINTESQTVRVEPLVNMGQITAALNPLGWTLPVVPELDDLTVGGLIMGFGVETSSHKYGLFQYICKSFELITAEGELIKCSPDRHPEIFYNIPWSYGTLGFLVAAELMMIPAKKYVRLSYHPVRSLGACVEVFESASRNTVVHDFVEAIVFSSEYAVIITGEMVDSKAEDGHVNRIGKYYKPWFFKHVEKISKTKPCAVEYIPLRHYYHRHTRSFFWEMESIIPFGNQSWFRYLLGWAIPPRISLLKMTETETTRRLRDQHHIVQDMLIPVEYLEKSLRYFHDHFRIYPLWLSPMSIYENRLGAGFLHPHQQTSGAADTLFVDVGAYGTAQVGVFDGQEALGNLEKFVIEHKGYQALYAKTTMTREEFRKMFDHKHYDSLRDSFPLCKKAFPEVYDKVSTAVRQSPSAWKKSK